MQLAESFTLQGSAGLLFDYALDYYKRLGYKVEKAEAPSTIRVTRGGGLFSAFATEIKDVKTIVSITLSQQADSVTVQVTYEVKSSGAVLTAKDREKLDAEIDGLNKNLQEVATTSGPAKTGIPLLDRALQGGISRSYAVMVSSPAVDQREMLVSKFLETGLQNGEPCVLVSSDPIAAAAFMDRYPGLYHAVCCNPQAASIYPQGKPNFYAASSAEDINRINMVLTDITRSLPEKPRRIVLTTVTDTLLALKAHATRKWLSELVPKLKLNKFTILAVMNPSVHPHEESQAILDLFDGQIDLSERELQDAKGVFLKVKRMLKQKYSEGEYQLTRDEVA